MVGAEEVTGSLNRKSLVWHDKMSRVELFPNIADFNDFKTYRLTNRKAFKNLIEG